jgi:hypothetical protein
MPLAPPLVHRCCPAASRDQSPSSGQRKGIHQIRMIIDATSRADNKTKSRWTRALRYAWHERREWKRLATFFEEHGGPTGCAARFAALKANKPATGPVIFRCPGSRRPFLIIENGK